MSRKPKHPYRHSGKLSPIRTADDIAADVQAAIEGDNFNQVPTLDRYRRFIGLMMQAESDMAGDDMEEFKKRTAILAEASAWLDLIETWWKDDAGNDRSLSADDAKRLAFNAVHIGMLLGKAQWRLMEGYAVDALETSMRAAEQAAKNKGTGIKLDRKTLLAEMKKAATTYPSANQKRLCEIVAKKVSTPDRTIGGERLRQLLREQKISASDYKPKK